MKRILVIFFALFLDMATLQAGNLPFDIEAGGGISFSSGNNNFFVEGSALVHVHKNLYLRSKLVEITFGTGSSISLGTGVGLDLMLFTKRAKISPYFVGGFNLFSTSGSSTFSAVVGGGMEFGKKKGFRPFVEGSLEIYSVNFGGASSSSTAFNIKGGIRI